MIVNKHGSFYMRSGWGTKIIHAVSDDPRIFSPSREQEAVDNIGVGRIMIKAMRYWSNVFGLTIETKDQEGIVQTPTLLFRLIQQNDPYFQEQGTLLLMHRNLALNKENATAWYWFFNTWNNFSISKEEFIEAFHSYLAVNEVNVRKAAIDKEYNCLRSTYVGKDSFDIKGVMDEDASPFLGALRILYDDEGKKITKRPLSKTDIPLEILVYSIAMDNLEQSGSCGSISIDKLMEEPGQVSKYFNIHYSKLIEILLEAENRGYLSLNNNFGNRYLEFIETNYQNLLNKYFENR